MNREDSFLWLRRAATPGDGYKFVGGGFFPDENARAYAFDDNGEMSFVSLAGVDRRAYPALYGRHLGLRLPGTTLPPRNVRVLVPLDEATRVLYVHDGQNVFRRDSSIPDGYVIPDGGWGLDDSAPDDTLVVAIDNTGERFADYTPVVDDIGFGDVGGNGDAYADFIEDVVRVVVDDVYGEPAVVGTMGSSLGGLISLAIADRYPDSFDFAAGLSSTIGWGSLGNVGADDGDDTLIDAYRGQGVRHTALYLDSGGDGGSGCADSDGDGVNDDDGEADDNFCETVQLRDLLHAEGYVDDTDLFYFYDAGPSGNGDAQHTESAWRFRAANLVFPIFSSIAP